MKLLTMVSTLISVAASMAEAAVERLPQGFPTRRGPLVFVKAEVLARPWEHAEDFAWVQQFDVVLTNGLGIAEPEVRDQLQKQGCRLFLYFWTNGFYEGPQPDNPPYGAWLETLVQDHPEWLLTGKPLPSLAGRPAYYFDLANPDLVQTLATRLEEAGATTGYDGLFFDYAGAFGLPAEVAAAWRELHPDEPYDRCFRVWLRKLRELNPELLLFTNQAYRSQEPLLSEVDYELTESMATSFIGGPQVETDQGPLQETFFRPWSGEYGLEALYIDLEERLRKAERPPKLFYLDYARAGYARGNGDALEPTLEREVVYYSYCSAALWGRESYCSGWYAAGREYRGPLYFADLGRPLGPAPRREGNLVLREYERGLVALLAEPVPAETEWEIKEPGRGLYDLFDSQLLPVEDGRVRIHLNPSRSEVSEVLRPAARVYLKVRR